MGIFSRRQKKSVDVEPAEGPAPDEKNDMADVLAAADLADESFADGSIEEVAFDEFENFDDIDVEDVVKYAKSQSEIDNFLEGFDELVDVQDEFEAALIRMRSRSKNMMAFSKTIKRDMARGTEALTHVNTLQIENAKMQSFNEDQKRRLMDLEASLESSHATNENLRRDFDELSKQKGETDANLEHLRAELTETRTENRYLAGSLREKTAVFERQKSDINALKGAKSELSSALREAKKEYEEAQYRLSELEIKYEKAAAFQNTFISDREKFSEERKYLRHEIGALETKLEDVTHKLDRAGAERKELLSRLATEKFSMAKQSDSLTSEVGILREQHAVAMSDIARLTDQLAQERADREAAEAALHVNLVSLEDGRKNLSRANMSISEINMKYASDRVALDQLKDENINLRNANKLLQRDLSELADYKMQAEAAQIRADKLEERLAEFVESLDGVEPSPRQTAGDKSHVNLKLSEEDSVEAEAATAVKH